MAGDCYHMEVGVSQGCRDNMPVIPAGKERVKTTQRPKDTDSSLHP